MKKAETERLKTSAVPEAEENMDDERSSVLNEDEEMEEKLKGTAKRENDISDFLPVSVADVG